MAAGATSVEEADPERTGGAALGGTAGVITGTLAAGSAVTEATGATALEVAEPACAVLAAASDFSCHE